MSFIPTTETKPDAIVTEVDDQRWAWCRACTRTSEDKDPDEWALRHNRRAVCSAVWL